MSSSSRGHRFRTGAPLGRQGGGGGPSQAVLSLTGGSGTGGGPTCPWPRGESGWGGQRQAPRFSSFALACFVPSRSFGSHRFLTLGSGQVSGSCGVVCTLGLQRAGARGAAGLPGRGSSRLPAGIRDRARRPPHLWRQPRVLQVAVVWSRRPCMMPLTPPPPDERLAGEGAAQ